MRPFIFSIYIEFLFDDIEGAVVLPEVVQVLNLDESLLIEKLLVCFLFLRLLPRQDERLKILNLVYFIGFRLALYFNFKDVLLFVNPVIPSERHTLPRL